MDIFQKQIIYSYKLFTEFRIFLTIQITVFKGKLSQRYFFTVHYFIQKSAIRKWRKISSGRLLDGNIFICTRNKDRDHGIQLTAHINFYSMCYDARTKNKVTRED